MSHAALLVYVFQFKVFSPPGKPLLLLPLCKLSTGNWKLLLPGLYFCNHEELEGKRTKHTKKNIES